MQGQATEDTGADAKQLEIHREPHGNEYKQHQVVPHDAAIESTHLVQTRPIQVAELVP